MVRSLSLGIFLTREMSSNSFNHLIRVLARLCYIFNRPNSGLAEEGSWPVIYMITAPSCLDDALVYITNLCEKVWICQYNIFIGSKAF